MSACGEPWPGHRLGHRCTEPLGHGPLVDSDWDERVYEHGMPEAGWFWGELPSATRRDYGAIGL